MAASPSRSGLHAACRAASTVGGGKRLWRTTSAYGGGTQHSQNAAESARAHDRGRWRAQSAAVHGAAGWGRSRRWRMVQPDGGVGGAGCGQTVGAGSAACAAGRRTRADGDPAGFLHMRFLNPGAERCSKWQQVAVACMFIVDEVPSRCSMKCLHGFIGHHRISVKHSGSTKHEVPN